MAKIDYFCGFILKSFVKATTTVKPSRKEQAALEAAALLQQKEDSKKLRSYESDTWKKIEDWGRESGNLSHHLQSYCFAIAGKVRKVAKFEGFEVANGIRILETVNQYAPELLTIADKDETLPEIKGKQFPKLEITIEVISQAVLWDKKHKKWKNISYTFMSELASLKKPMSDQNKKIASWNLETLQKCGFEYKPIVIEEIKSAVEVTAE